MESVLPAAHEKVVINHLTDEMTSKTSITLLKTSRIIHKWSLSINDGTERISHKYVNIEVKGGEEITEVLADVALVLQRGNVPVKVLQWVSRKQVFIQNITFIFIAVFLWCRLEKEEKKCHKFHCCWKQVAWFVWHPLYFSVIIWSSPSHHRTDRAASLHTQSLPPKYLSQINDVVQGPWLTTCAWTQFPHG